MLILSTNFDLLFMLQVFFLLHEHFLKFQLMFQFLNLQKDPAG